MNHSPARSQELRAEIGQGDNWHFLHVKIYVENKIVNLSPVFGNLSGPLQNVALVKKFSW